MTTTEALFIPLPLRIRSEANGSHGHWATRARAIKEQRQAVAWCLKAHEPVGMPCTVKLTRIGPRKLDGHDNLPRAFKHVADQIAEWLGVKDNDPRLTWRYEQRSEGAGKYAAEVVITAGGAA